jgi:tRNA (guanosine-2'-O-)-methyltransferase
MADDPESFLLEERKTRVDAVVAGRTRSVVVVLDRLTDSFNQAAVLRTCEGMGIQEVHVVKHPEAGFQAHPGVTQGCDKWLDIALYETPRECAQALKARSYALWVSTLGEGSEALPELRFDGKVALVFGNEHAGVHPDMQALADRRFWIPMRGFTQSLNVSVAVATTVTQALFWRRRELGVTGDLTPEDAAQVRNRFYWSSLKQHPKLRKASP